MPDSIPGRLTTLITPILLLAASAIALAQLHSLPPVWQTVLLEALPPLMLACAAILSIRFNRSRYIFLLAFLAMAAAASHYHKLQPGSDLFNLFFAALFINSFLFSLTKDRSLFSIHGVIRLLFLAAQVGAVWYCVRSYNQDVSRIINMDLFALPAWLATRLPYPDLWLAGLTGICLLHLLLILIVRQASIQATFLGCQLGLLGIATGFNNGDIAPLLLVASGLMICISILTSSYDMAYRDELTGLPSRRALNQTMLSLGRHYTIAMMDIDHFKKFNDTHGHDTGDEVLRMVASRIARVGGGGKPFRYGGEEFTVVFPGKSADQVESHLDSLRNTIENYEMTVRSGKRPAKQKGNGAARRGKGGSSKKNLSVTISIGLAERNGNQKTPDQVIKAADQALYRAKKKGRNCVSR